jgi:hypothetical protein
VNYVRIFLNVSCNKSQYLFSCSYLSICLCAGISISKSEAKAEAKGTSCFGLEAKRIHPVLVWKQIGYIRFWPGSKNDSSRFSLEEKRIYPVWPGSKKGYIRFSPGSKNDTSGFGLEAKRKPVPNFSMVCNEECVLCTVALP